MLASATLQAKDTTIQAQQVLIAQQQQLLNSDVFIKSIRFFNDCDMKNKEELLDGTVAIMPYEGNGFELNLPELFRRLRKLFSKKDA